MTENDFFIIIVFERLFCGGKFFTFLLFFVYIAMNQNYQILQYKK